MSIFKFWDKLTTHWYLGGMCFPAAFEAISEGEITDQAYVDYYNSYWEHVFEGTSTKRTRNAFGKVLRQVGGSSQKRIQGLRIRNTNECVKALNNARQGGRRVIIWTSESHVVGLRPISRGWRMLGTGLPKDAENGKHVFTDSEIFPFLVQPSRKKLNKTGESKKIANMLIFSSEKKE